MGELEKLLAEADVVISSTGAREPILTRALFKKVTKARRWRPMIVIDIAVPRDAEPEIDDLDGVYLYDIDDLDKVVAANLAERAKAAEQAEQIVEHEAGQFEQWLRTQGVVPTIRALREHFAQVADAEVSKALDQLAQQAPDARAAARAAPADRAARRQQAAAPPTTALRGARPTRRRCARRCVCELFGLEPVREPERRVNAVAEPARQRASCRAKGRRA